MESQRRSLGVQAVGVMMLVCFIWANAQIGLKYTSQDMAPTLQIGLRSAGAALLVYLFVKYKGQQLITIKGSWVPGIVVGALFAGEFFFIGEALRYTAASHVSIFLYTAPIFVALGLHFFLPEERLKTWQWLGIMLAFVGVSINFLGQDPNLNTPQNPNMLFGDALAVMAGFLWGCSTVVVRVTRLQFAPATETLFYQLIVAFVLITTAALVTGQTHVNWTLALGVNFIFQVIVVSFVSLLLWFWLLCNYLASRLGVLSFMTPMFGVILGVLLLGEKITLHFIVGALCVVLGIVLVNGKGLVKKK